jgi:hypothetical protein
LTPTQPSYSKEIKKGVKKQDKPYENPPRGPLSRSHLNNQAVARLKIISGGHHADSVPSTELYLHLYFFVVGQAGGLTHGHKASLEDLHVEVSIGVREKRSDAQGHRRIEEDDRVAILRPLGVLVQMAHDQTLGGALKNLGCDEGDLVGLEQVVHTSVPVETLTSLQVTLLSQSTILVAEATDDALATDTHLILDTILTALTDAEPNLDVTGTQAVCVLDAAPLTRIADL